MIQAPQLQFVKFFDNIAHLVMLIFTKANFHMWEFLEQLWSLLLHVLSLLQAFWWQILLWKMWRRLQPILFPLEVSAFHFLQPLITFITKTLASWHITASISFSKILAFFASLCHRIHLQESISLTGCIVCLKFFGSYRMTSWYMVLYVPIVPIFTCNLVAQC